MRNVHGDVMLLADGLGTNISTGSGPANAHVYDPFGNLTPAGTFPNNTQTSSSYAYVGRAQKITETALSPTPIQMGARVYLPGLGRFTQVDPVEGGVQNNYVYPADPVNDYDLDGRCAMLCVLFVVPFVVSALTFVTTKAPQIINFVAARGQALVGGAGMAVNKAGNVIRSTAQKVIQGGRSISNKIQSFANNNNFVRVGRERPDTAFRISLGPAYNHYQRLNTLGKALSPIHIHIEKRYGGIDFNWFLNSTGRPMNWTWWD